MLLSLGESSFSPHMFSDTQEAINTEAALIGRTADRDGDGNHAQRKKYEQSRNLGNKRLKK